MFIPSSVKIGGITFKVEILDEWPTRNGDDGECNVETNTIYLWSRLSQEAKEITFIHESLHAMNSTMNHEFLDSLAEQLYQFLSDNKLIN